MVHGTGLIAGMLALMILVVTSMYIVRRVEEPTIKKRTVFLPTAYEVWAKVMFSQVFICSQGCLHIPIMHR